MRVSKKFKANFFELSVWFRINDNDNNNNNSKLVIRKLKMIKNSIYFLFCHNNRGKKSKHKKLKIKYYLLLNNKKKTFNFELKARSGNDLQRFVCVKSSREGELCRKRFSILQLRFYSIENCSIK